MNNLRAIWSLPPVTRRAARVWRRNFDVFVRTWKVNFFPPFVEALLYLSAIGLGIGTYVGALDGVPYVVYICTGHPCHIGHELGIF